MKKNIIRRLTQSLLLASSVALTVCRLEAVDVNLFGTNMPPVDFHGFVSQGFLATSKYNYLGGDTKAGSLGFTEAGLNVSMNPLPRTHITAQGFLFDVGNVGQYDPVLDYALVDYNFSDAFGIRAGRILRPEGIYNTIQSIDLARTWILLPQGMYDARWRDFDGSLDGGSIYGDIGLSKVGDLSYELYAGMIDVAANGGVSRELQNLFNNPPVTSFTGMKNDAAVYGGQLWWNTPVDGLRAGIAGFISRGLSYGYRVNPPFGPGAITGFNDANPQIHGSLEYLWKNWTFQAEYKYVDNNIHGEVGGNLAPNSSINIGSDTWYVGAAYRFNKWLEIGSYYTEDYFDVSNRDGHGTAVPSDSYQKDVAISLRFDPKPWWIIKAEAHYIRGTALLQDSADNPVRNGDGWFMLALKTTFSF
jgi:hypothetical protein